MNNSKKDSFKKNIEAYIYLIPTIIIILFWFIKPLIETLLYAFSRWNMLPGTEPTFIGLDNFSRLFNHPDFIQSVTNTFFYILMMIPFSIIIPLFIVGTTQFINKKWARFFRFAVVLPMIVPPVANSTIYRWILHPTNGILNKLLMDLNIIESGIGFFTDENWARLIIALLTGLQMIGFGTLMFSSAIVSIDDSYYEAAELDGSSKVRQFFDITIPLLSPSITYMFMFSILFGSQWAFVYIDVLTQGGPYGTSTNIFYLMYEFAFLNQNVGLSAATSLVFLLAFGILAYFLIKLRNKLTFYDN